MKPGPKFLNCMENFLKKRAMFVIAIAALLAWLLFYLASQVAGTETFPVGYWQKVPFGIVVACIGLGCAFLWIKLTRPESWDKLNEETAGGVSSLDEWQRVKVSLFWVFTFIILYAIGVFAL